MAEFLLELRLVILPDHALDSTSNIGRARYDVRGISELLRHLASRNSSVRHPDVIPAHVSSDPLTTPLDFVGAWAPLCPAAPIFQPTLPVVEEQQLQSMAAVEAGSVEPQVLSVLADQLTLVHEATANLQETLSSSNSSANERLDVLADCALQQLAHFIRYKAEMENKFADLNAYLATLNQEYAALKAQLGESNRLDRPNGIRLGS